MFLGRWSGGGSGGLIRAALALGCSIVLLVLHQDVQSVGCSSLEHGIGPLASRDEAPDALCPREFRGCNWYCPNLPERCTGDRLLPDPCQCCTLCMKQTGERCAVPRDACDSAFQLTCFDGRCKGKCCVSKKSTTTSNDSKSEWRSLRR